MEILSCISLGFELLNELIDIRSKLKTDQDCYDDLIKLITNYKTYNKREKKLIRQTLIIFLEHNKTRQASNVSLQVQPAEHSGHSAAIEEEKKVN